MLQAGNILIPATSLLLGSLYHMWQAKEGRFSCNLHLWKPDSYGYVAYLDGEPVAGSATFPVDDTVYVGFVATHPDHQRRGYAEAVMRHSIEMGMKGMRLTRTSLHATAAGKPLYEAMGYEGGSLFHLICEPHD